MCRTLEEKNAHYWQMWDSWQWKKTYPLVCSAVAKNYILACLWLNKQTHCLNDDYSVPPYPPLNWEISHDSSEGIHVLNMNNTRWGPFKSFSWYAFMIVFSICIISEGCYESQGKLRGFVEFVTFRALYINSLSLYVSNYICTVVYNAIGVGYKLCACLQWIDA